MNLDSGVNEQLAKSGGFGIDPLESNYFSFFAVVLVVVPLVMWLAVSVPFLLLAIPFAPIAIAIVLLCVLTVYTSKIVSLYGLDRLGKAKHRQDRAEEVGTAEGPGEADDSKTGDGGEEDDDGGLKGLADVEIELEQSAETGWRPGVKGKARKMRRFSEMSLRDKLRVQPDVYGADPSDEVALRLKIFAVLSLAGINVMLAFNALYDGGNWVAVFRNALDSIRFSLRVDFAIGWAWPESLKWPELSVLAQVQFAVSVGLFATKQVLALFVASYHQRKWGKWGSKHAHSFWITMKDGWCYVPGPASWLSVISRSLLLAPLNLDRILAGKPGRPILRCNGKTLSRLDQSCLTLST